MRGRYTYMRDIIYSALPKVFGSPNGISHSSICAEAEKFGAYYTEGLWDYRDYDLSRSKYLLIWGCDPVSSNRMIPATIKRFGEVLDRATVAVVDPKLNSSAAKAHEWLPVKPGEDGALASAIAHVILVKGLWSREFVGDFKDGVNRFKAGSMVDETAFKEKQTHGLVKWWNLELKDMTPERAEKITLIDQKQIERVAVGLGRAAPYAIVWLGPGAAMQVRGEKAFIPHYESPYRYGSLEEYPFTFIDFKSKLNREGRSANCTWYHEFKKVDIGDKSWEDALQINPADAARLGIKDGDRVEVTSVAATITAIARYSEGIRPGTVTKCFGQGHWAYGRVAADYKNARPKGGNNNERCIRLAASASRPAPTAPMTWKQRGHNTVSLASMILIRKRMLLTGIGQRP